MYLVTLLLVPGYIIISATTNIIIVIIKCVAILIAITNQRIYQQK